MYVLIKFLESEKVTDGLEGITGTNLLLSAVMGTKGSILDHFSYGTLLSTAIALKRMSSV